MNAISNIHIMLNLLLLLIFGACSGRNSSETSGNKAQTEKEVIVFHRVKEPNENAFSFLLPQNWTVSGGITRVDPNSSGGPANSIEAKLYMKLSSPDEKAAICWLPDTRFYDMQRCPTRNLIGSMFTTGSNYNGMMVLPILNPEQFVLQVAIPFAHPHAQQVKVVQILALPELAAQYRQLSVKMLSGYSFNYAAAIATIEYIESTISYLEKMVCVIEDYGQQGAGIWGNKETWYVRTEKGKFESMAPVFSTIGQSVKLNPEWILREIRSQQTNSQIAIETHRYIANIDKEITEHRAHANAEINNDMYLNLTGQEDYTNPFTGETERGTNEWNYRWENEQGDVIYSDNQSYSPNSDNNIQFKEFKRSEIRKR
jgi:hypothetical protein